MYCGVPSESPVWVMRCPPACCTASAMPKSATSAWPPCSRMFSGLMSRWMMPMRVRGAQRVGHLARDAQRVVDGELPLALEPGAQRLAAHVAA